MGLTISSIKDYVGLVEEIKRTNEKQKNKSDLIFRGQRTDEPLLPKLARLELKGKINSLEKLMLADFQRMSLPLSKFKPQDDWDTLALAQHHGLPTRLLDWTYNALMGLWFAVNKPPKEDIKGRRQNGVIWIGKPIVEDFNIANSVGPFDVTTVKIRRSNTVTMRISAQSGIFTVHPLINDKITALEDDNNFKNKLIKVKIPADKFSPIRKQLHIMGVNHSSVFPDIDGLCKFLEWRYSKYKDEIKKVN